MSARHAGALLRGERVKLIELPENSGYDVYGLSAGDEGIVELVDSLGTTHVWWDKGQRIGILAEHCKLIRSASELLPSSATR